MFTLHRQGPLLTFQSHVTRMPESMLKVLSLKAPESSVLNVLEGEWHPSLLVLDVLTHCSLRNLSCLILPVGRSGEKGSKTLKIVLSGFHVRVRLPIL